MPRWTTSIARLLVMALVAAALALAPTPVGAQTVGTEVAGTLPSGDTIWTPDNSPYVLTADVIVPTDGFLYIAPGTTVTSEGDHQLIVNGLIRTDATTFDLAGGVVVDSTVDTPGDHGVFHTTTFRNATGAALHVEEGSAVPLFAAFEDNAIGMTSGPDAQLVWLNYGRMSGNDTLAIAEGRTFIITDAHISDFERGVVSTHVYFNSNVVEPPTGPCTADGTGCVAALQPVTEYTSTIDGTWFGTTDGPTIQGMLWDGTDDAALETFTGTPAAEWFDVEAAQINIDLVPAALPATGATITGTVTDLPNPGGAGAQAAGLWLYDATNLTVWDSVAGEWVPVGVPVEDSDLVPTTGGAEWSASLPDLAVGHDYVAVAFAVEQGAAGLLSTSEPVSFTAVDDPGAPTITSATVQPDGSVVVEWDPPADTGGADVETYELVCAPDPQPPLGDLAPETMVVPGTTTTATVEPAVGVDHSCTVVATTAGGTGPASAPVVVRVAPPSPSFGDVPAGTSFTDAVGWAQALGLTTGVGGSDQFQPHRDISRAETITMLWRHAGSPTGFPPHGFDDASTTAFYARARDWARNDGLTGGVAGTNQFQPDRSITRVETITLLWRIAGSPTGHAPHGFDDAAATAFYSPALNWARAEGLTTGVAGTNYFQPDRTITRAETTTLLHRAATGS